MPILYFEDISAGDVRNLGSFSLTQEEMVSFANRYDPQPIHVDPAAAAESIFGGIIASGWQTGASCMRLLVDEFLNEAASMGALGAEEIRWPAPTRPGDAISVTNKVLGVRISESRDSRGYVRNRTRGENERGEEVISWIGTNIIARREVG